MLLSHVNYNALNLFYSTPLTTVTVYCLSQQNAVAHPAGNWTLALFNLKKL